MDVSSHFRISILTVSQFSENRKAGEPVLLTLTATAQRGSLLESRARLLLSLLTIPICVCLCFTHSPLFKLLDMVVGAMHGPLFKKLRAILGWFWRSAVWAFASPHVHSAEVSLSKLLNHCRDVDRATSPDFCLLWMRANKKDKSPTCFNPSAHLDWTVSLSLKAATCLDEPAARWFCPVCVLVVGVEQNKSGTCLLRQHHHLSRHTMQAECSPLAPRSGCVKQPCRAKVEGAHMQVELWL